MNVVTINYTTKLQNRKTGRTGVIYMYYLNTTCPLSHHYNGFMATGNGT